MGLLTPDFSSRVEVTSFQADAMYFHAAKKSLASAQACEQAIQAANDRFAELEAEEREILERYGNNAAAAYDEGEPIWIAMESAHFEIGLAYAPYLQQLATVQISCAASLEAHINDKSEKKLSGRLLDVFTQVNLEGKWLMLPKLLGAPGFDPGQHPFQGFSAILKRRNKLVHHKPWTEEWRYGQVPERLTELGLEARQGSEAIDATSAMVRSLARCLGEEPPTWLDLDSDSYFTFAIIERPTAGNRTETE